MTPPIGPVVSPTGIPINPPMPTAGMTYTQRAEIEMLRRELERSIYGNRPGEGVIDATIRLHDPHHGAGFTGADELAIIVANRAAECPATNSLYADASTMTINRQTPYEHAIQS